MDAEHLMVFAAGIVGAVIALFGLARLSDGWRWSGAWLVVIGASIAFCWPLVKTFG